jgi:hypothetical protein
LQYPHIGPIIVTGFLHSLQNLHFVIKLIHDNN